MAITDLAALEASVEEVQGVFGGEALWWRGHENAGWTLQAGVFRPRPQGGKYTEHALASKFKSRALGMLGHRDKPGSELEWLLLAQHYGVPTRLLDWTENPLIALYFALGGKRTTAVKSEADACLWAMSPSHLNKNHSCPSRPEEAQFGLIDSEERVVRAMAQQAFGFKDEYVEKHLGFSPSDLPKTIAIESPETDARIIAQAGRFTLHDGSCVLGGFEGADLFLRKFIVPACKKTELRQRLEWFGMQDWILFPDLESLALGLKSHEFTTNPEEAA
jgi:FRG domain